MNKSIFSKNKIASKNNYFNSGINVNDLSATSSVFMSNIKQNLKGGFLLKKKELRNSIELTKDQIEKYFYSFRAKATKSRNLFYVKRGAFPIVAFGDLDRRSRVD